MMRAYSSRYLNLKMMRVFKVNMKHEFIKILKNVMFCVSCLNILALTCS